MIHRSDMANAIRMLSMDAIQQANSGHPGAPLGMADIAQVLWSDFLQHNPNNPKWVNRDRFVLSNGHGSMLLYSLLHLTGYDLSIEDIKQFRQLHSRTPGHPEFGITPGVETTTGPLGQGIATAVGMAIAERTLAAQFNQEDVELINHYTYVFLGDGCLMEGISHEACSLAGNLALGKLIAFWDDNGISIDGRVTEWFSDDTPARFRAYDWHVISDIDGHDPESIKAAIIAAQHNTQQPTLICCKTTIAKGAPNAAGSHHSHGAPLGNDEIAAARQHLHWPYEPFVIPDAIYAAWDGREAGHVAESAWNEKFTIYREKYPQLAADFERRTRGELPHDWQETCQQFIKDTNDQAKDVASRKASEAALNAYAPILTELVGGSADLTASNNTRWSGAETQTINNPQGNYINYGVREFAMSAIVNGLALHGGFIPFAGTFLTFCDYARNAIRLAALMQSHSIFVYTHDSIGLGEDGPTHQPIEHIAQLRITPGLTTWRPCDAVETAVAWQIAIEQKGPSCLLFSRQTLAHQRHTPHNIQQIKRGGYVLYDCQGTADAIIIATGSEVSLAATAANLLTEQGKKIRVVSMPSTTMFDKQDASYRESVLPSHITQRVAIEAGVPDGWYRYVGTNGRIIGIQQFGESAPAKQVYESLGITVQALVNAVNDITQ